LHVIYLCKCYFRWLPVSLARYETVTDMWHIGARLWWWKWGSWSRQKDT